MMDAISRVLKEVYNNRRRLIRLAFYDLKLMNKGTLFGLMWNLFNPALQILVYWFVFGYILDTPPPRGEYIYIVWMITGIIPWFYISESLMSSTVSIYSFAGVLKRMYIPLAIVPVKSVLTSFMSHLVAMFLVLTIYVFSGYKLKLGVIYLLYYMFCSFVFLTAYAMLASTITVLFKDFQRIMGSIIRFLFYITPIVWVPETLSEKMQLIVRLNPLAYIVMGYRNSILYGSDLMYNWKQGVYFWTFTAILFIIGCRVHVKIRKQFVDLI